MLSKSAQLVLLASVDKVLIAAVRGILESFGSRVVVVCDGDAVLAAVGPSRPFNFPGVILLDARLPGIAEGWLLAGVHESGVHRQCALAVITESVPVGELVVPDKSEFLAARLREGVIDAVIPRNADAAAWSSYLAAMLRGHRLYCELEEMREANMSPVEHDPLTGLFNRETILSLLFRETDRVQRLHGSLCLMLLDLDDFGNWNREFGAEVCDQLLRHTAKKIGQILRSYDLLARVGGDEFLLALPGCSTVNAVMLAERIRMEVFGDLFAVNDGHYLAQVRLTACFGIARSGGRSPVVVLREAERALAQAKGCGPDGIRCMNDQSCSLSRLLRNGSENSL